MAVGYLNRYFYNDYRHTQHHILEIILPCVTKSLFFPYWHLDRMWVGWIAPRALAKQRHKIIVLFFVAPLDSLQEIMWLLYKWWVTMSSREMSQGIAWHHKLRKDRVWVLFHAIRTSQSIFFMFCRCLLCEQHNYFYQSCLHLAFLIFIFFLFSHKTEVNALL